LALLLVSAKFAETVDQATIVLDLVGDNSLAILKISYREIVSRTLTQSIGNFAFEPCMPPNRRWLLAPWFSPTRRIHAEKNGLSKGSFDMDRGRVGTPSVRTPWVWKNNPKRPTSIEVKLPISDDREMCLNAL
jgi:hypothetical protein